MKNKYIQTPQYVLDLHGFTTSETQVILDDLIAEGAYKYVRVIIGKGLNSPNGPILPDFVKQYFNSRGIRYSPSKPQDGGEGALEVFL